MSRHLTLCGAVLGLLAATGAMAEDAAAPAALKVIDLIAIPDGPWDYASIDAAAPDPGSPVSSPLAPRAK